MAEGARALQNVIYEYPYPWNDNFYAEDKRVGIYCDVDGKGLYTECNADLYSMVITPGEVGKSMLRKVGRSQLRVSGVTYGVPQMELGFYVGGPNKREAMYNVNVLARMFEGGVHDFMTEEEDYIYHISRASYTVEETDVPCFYDVKMTCDYVKHLPLETRTIVVSQAGGGEYIENIGTVPSGVEVTVTPRSAVNNLVIMGCTIKSIESGGSMTIDGIDGVVTDNRGYAYSKTEFTKFPKMNPGSNLIASDVLATIKVSWYPTFEV